MRQPLRVLYYPDFVADFPTLVKSIILFDEIHFMDRSSRTFDGQTITLGSHSPMRQYEESFRAEDVPLYVHEPPSGFVAGELRAAVETDLSDFVFLARFQEGLQSSLSFRNLQIQPGNYGGGETHETIFLKLAAIKLQENFSPVEVLEDRNILPFDFKSEAGILKTFVQKAAFCFERLNFALKVGATESFSPLADMSPTGSLLGAKYSRAIAAASAGGASIFPTDLSLAIVDELIPADRLGQITIGHAVKIRKETESERAAFLDHVLGLQARLGGLPVGSDYAATINKIVTTEIRPAAAEYRRKLDTIWERLLGSIATGAVTWAGSSALIQLLGDLSWENILLAGASATSFVAAKGIEAILTERATTRDCALAFLLNLSEPGKSEKPS
jgi:hypothetical protein